MILQVLSIGLTIAEGVGIVCLLGLYSEQNEKLKRLKGEFNHNSIAIKSQLRELEIKLSSIQKQSEITHQMALYSYNTIKNTECKGKHVKEEQNERLSEVE